jgi:hypothetical protein
MSAPEAPSPAIARHARMRYWRPDSTLAPYVSGYHLYAVDPPQGLPWPEDVFFPAWTNLRILLTPESVWEIRQRGREWGRITGATVFGPTSGITWTRSNGGVAVGAGLRPAGAFRLLRTRASAVADRVVPAAQALHPPVDTLVKSLTAAADDEAVPLLFDAFLREAIAPEPEVDNRIAAVEAALLDPLVKSVAQLLERVGLGARALQRLCERAFGLPPRMLLRRARFLRSFDAIRASGRGLRATLIDPRYVDYAHFAKDAQAFFGMSPESFIKLDTPLARQSMALRRKVLGAPVQALATIEDGEGFA